MKKLSSQKHFLDLSKKTVKKKTTKHIKFDCLERSEYMKEKKKTHPSKIIFSLRSGTLHIKKWNSRKYQDNLCVMCDIKEENITHF